MRLINTNSFKLEFFLGDDVPPYAILSHTWGAEEVSLEDFLRNPNLTDLKGYEKLKHSCETVSLMGHKYIWIDTCCIDKSSSAELSEAINSMFRWYRNADICIAYLADVIVDESTGRKDAGFAKSRWFTRGWTLQELIAPINVVFYNGTWNHLGTRAALKAEIEKITGIPGEAFDPPTDLEPRGEGSPWSHISVAQKMSWAADRKTTRGEDVAYCLLGLFDITMPLLYGEGKEKAFKRLQEEIVKSTDDDTIYAWTLPEGSNSSRIFWGLLAKSPAAFSNRNGFEFKRPKYLARHSAHDSTSVNNFGLHIKLPLTPCPKDLSDTIFLGFLGCDIESNKSNETMTPVILLQSISLDSESHVMRIKPDLLLIVTRSGIFVPGPRASLVRWAQTQPLLTVEEACPRQIFVPHECPEPRHPKGIIVQLHKFSRWMDAHPSVDFCGWERVERHMDFDNSYAMEFDANTCPNPTDLTEPIVLGRLPTYSPHRHGYVVVGLQPVPQNPFSTPARYCLLWHFFEDENSCGLPVVNFTLKSKHSRLFYFLSVW